MKIGELVKGMQHIGLPTENIEETIRFYDGLGFTVAYRTESGKCAFLKLQNVMIETYEVQTAAGISGAINHIALDVADVEKAFALAKEQQLEIVSNGVEALPFWDNGVKFFIVLGPNGERVEFNQYL